MAVSHLRVDRRLPVPAVDLALAGAALVALVVQRIAVAPALGGTLPVALALSVVIAGGLAVRRRLPLTGYLLGSAALSVEVLWVLANPLTPYANLIGLYSLGLYGTQRRALWGLVLLPLGVLAYFTATDAPWTAPAGVVFVWLLAWGAGYGGARRRELLEAARGRLRREAIAGERNRIARELHDLVGHAVNVMLVRVGAARVVLDRAPEQAREILLGVEQTGRETLDELDLMLGTLRDGDGILGDGGGSLGGGDGSLGGGGGSLGGGDGTLRDGGGTGLGRPGLAELPRLAERMTQAGMAVTMQVDLPTGQLPASLDLSAYRIVQEALTNALRHGQAGSASVHVTGDGRRLELEVRDDGRGPEPGYQPGRGLLGIAERAATFGGSVEHGRGSTGGFRVRAVLRLR